MGFLNTQTDISLNSIMNKMAREEVCRAPKRTLLSSEKPQKFTEIEGFAVIDDILGALRKEYLNARRYRKDLSQTQQSDDAMLEMAIDMEDSVWCAMQTRYLELRDGAVLMRRVQKMIYQQDLKIQAYEVAQQEQRLEREKRQDISALQIYLKMLVVMKEKNKTPQILEWLILFLIFDVPITGAKKIEPVARMAA